MGRVRHAGLNERARGEEGKGGTKLEGQGLQLHPIIAPVKIHLGFLKLGFCFEEGKCDTKLGGKDL